MAIRKVITERQRRAAVLLLNGESGYKALRQAGYSHYMARNFGSLLRSSWGLREAIRQEQEHRAEYLDKPAPKRRRYDRRWVSAAVQKYANVKFPEDQLSTNRHMHKLHDDMQRATSIARGDGDPGPRTAALKAWRCSVCGGPLEGADRWCVHWQRCER